MIFQTHKTLIKKPSAPLRDDLPWQAQAPTDFLIVQPLGGQEDELGPDNKKIR